MGTNSRTTGDHRPSSPRRIDCDYSLRTRETLPPRNARAIMWLPTLVSTLFLAEAIWRFVDEGDTVEQRANAKFNGVNLVIIALLGLSCVSWPLISAKFQGQKDEKNVECFESGQVHHSRRT